MRIFSVRRSSFLCFALLVGFLPPSNAVTSSCFWGSPSFPIGMVETYVHVATPQLLDVIFVGYTRNGNVAIEDAIPSQTAAGSFDAIHLQGEIQPTTAWLVAPPGSAWTGNGVAIHFQFFEGIWQENSTDACVPVSGVVK